MDPIFNPLFAVREIATGLFVDAAEESATDTTSGAVIYGYGTFDDIFASWQGHGSPPFLGLMVNA